MPSPALKSDNTSSNGKSLAALTGLIIIAVVFFALYPLATRVAEISRAIDDVKTELKQKQVQNYSLPELIAAYRRYEPAIAELEKSVRAQNRELEFITILEALADKNNLQQKINVGEFTEMETLPFYRLPLNIVIEGDFIDTVRYLQEMEALSTYVNVTQLNITADRRVSQPTDPAAAERVGRVKTSITADTFWQ